MIKKVFLIFGLMFFASTILCMEIRELGEVIPNDSIYNVCKFFEWVHSDKNKAEVDELSKLLGVSLAKQEETTQNMCDLIDIFLEKNSVEEAEKIARILPRQVKKEVLDFWLDKHQALLIKLGVRTIEPQKKSDVFEIISFMKEFDVALDSIGYKLETIAMAEEDWLDNLSDDVVEKLKKIYEKKSKVIKYMDKKAKNIIKAKLEDIDRATKEPFELKKVNSFLAECLPIFNL